MENMNPKVDGFLNRSTRWRAEYEKLRKIALDCELTEELKWGVPCYTNGKGNIVLIHGFNEYCAYLFPKGVLLKDPAGILIIQTENSQSARQIRFTSVDQIEEMEPILKAYLQEAVAVENAGLKVEFKKVEEFNMVEEFRQKLNELPELSTAFHKLTPGRQRGYLLYFAAPKLAKTREARVDKYIPKILEGKGFND